MRSDFYFRYPFGGNEPGHTKKMLVAIERGVCIEVGLPLEARAPLIRGFRERTLRRARSRSVQGE